MKEGTIIPYQDTKDGKIDTTTDLVKDDGLDLLIFPDSNGFAEGTVYIDDDGESQSDLDTSKFKYYKIKIQQEDDYYYFI